MKAAQAYIGKERDIPLTYMASIPEGFDTDDYGLPEYDKRSSRHRRRTMPGPAGKLLRVDAPHFMEPAIPGEIVEALRDVIAKAAY